MFNSVRLELTGRCDMQCLYCHAGEKNTACYNREELSHERWLEIIGECRQSGVKNFILTGGEPFLYKRWPEIVAACGTESRVVFSTNGKHFSQENLELIASCFPQVAEFRTSLDGLATNDIIREGSSFIEALDNIRRVREMLPDRKVMVQTVIYQQNLGEIAALYEELKHLGIYCWRLSQLWKTVRTEKNRDILDFSDYEQMFALYADVIKKHQVDEKPFLLRIDNVYYSWIDKEDYAPMDLAGHPCAYNFNYLCINANGDLIFCPAMNMPYASVKESTVQEAVSQSTWLQEYKGIKVSDLGCGDCRYIQICGGGCRADSLRWLGSVQTVDPNSCCMMPLIESVILPLLGEGERLAFSNLINKNGSYPAIAGKNLEEAITLLKKKGG